MKLLVSPVDGSRSHGECSRGRRSAQSLPGNPAKVFPHVLSVAGFVIGGEPSPLTQLPSIKPRDDGEVSLFRTQLD